MTKHIPKTATYPPKGFMGTKNIGRNATRNEIGPRHARIRVLLISEPVI
jgi:hypothetical protein